MNEESVDTTVFDRGGRYKYIFDNLIIVVKQCQQKYGGRTELATEQDDLIMRLCDTWEEAISYGIKSPQLSVLKNVQELVSGHLSGGHVNEPNFWEFCLKHLTEHEKERFENLRHVQTPRGKTKALIRASLNERALERYVLKFLSDPDLNSIFEPWSLMSNAESNNLLPSMAAGLSSILFAIAVDTADINVTNTRKSEPIVYTPPPVGPTKKKTAVQRQIISLEDNNSCEMRDEEETLEDETLASIKEMCNGSFNGVASNDTTIARSEDLAVDVSVEHYKISQKLSTSNVDGFHSDDDANDDDNNYDSRGGCNTSSLDPSLNNLSVTPEMPSESSSYFSRQSSPTASGPNVITDIHQLEHKLKGVSEKCAFLEARVAELTLENRRLHRLMNHRGNSENWQFLVSIPNAILSKSVTRRNYYEYEIHVNFTNDLNEWIVFRRYSEFYKLHEKFKKNNTLVKALDFPPKKKIGNMDIAFVEGRRQRLQIYLRHLLAILPEVSTCTTKFQLQNIFPFLRE